MAAPVVIDTVGMERFDAVMAVMTGAFDPQHGEAWSRPQLTSQMVLPGSLLWLAQQDGVPVAFALCSQLLDEAELMLLAVMPEWRRQGIGEALMQRVVEDLSQNGVTSLFLEVRATNPARVFYELAGFVAVGRRPDYYRCPDGSRVDAITMRCTIDPDGEF